MARSICSTARLTSSALAELTQVRPAKVIVLSWSPGDLETPSERLRRNRPSSLHEWFVCFKRQQSNTPPYSRPESPPLHRLAKTREIVCVSRFMGQAKTADGIKCRNVSGQLGVAFARHGDKAGSGRSLMQCIIQSGLANPEPHGDLAHRLIYVANLAVAPRLLSRDDGFAPAFDRVPLCSRFAFVEPGRPMAMADVTLFYLRVAPVLEA